jgi:hypothetical protein
MQPTAVIRQGIINSLVIEIPKQAVPFLFAVIKDPFANGFWIFIPLRTSGDFVDDDSKKKKTTTTPVTTRTSSPPNHPSPDVA